MRKKYLALLLAMTMVTGVTACGQKEGEEARVYGEGVDSSFETKDMQLETPIMAVGEEEITLNEMLFYMYRLKSTYDGDLTPDVWNYQYDGQETIGEYTKDRLVKEIAQVKIICQEAAAQGVTLTEQEANEASVAAGQFMEALPAGNEDYNLTREMIADIYQEHALAKKMYDVVGGNIDNTVSDEEAKQVTVSYIEILTQGTDRNGNQVELSNEQKKSALKRAKKLQKNAASVEDFQVYANKNSDVDATEMKVNSATEPAELQAVLDLEQGQVSPVIETENAYYICYCKEAYNADNATEYKEAILQEREKQAFLEAFQQWKANYKVVVSSSLLKELK